MTDDPGRTTRSLNLTTGGLTLLSVLLGIGITVAFGLETVWWGRVLAGVATTAALVAVVKLTTSAGRGPIARAANWVISDRPHHER